jgi:aldehyde:ferredoxin oxidoreductase
MPKVGPYYGTIGDNPDYELQAYLGPNLGIFTPEDNVYLAARMDDLGFCGINVGNVLGFAAELYEKEILTKKDLGGLDLQWGNTKAFEALAQMIAQRKGIGEILAEGTYRAAVEISKMKKTDVLPYAVQSKGVAIGAHGVRSGLDYPDVESYACSVQGGDHTSIAQLPIDHDNSELSVMFFDSGVYCWFNTFDIPFDVNISFLNAVTGWNITKEEWYDPIALRILQLQRALLLLGGPDLTWKPKVNDEIPDRFYEPLPTGPQKGKKVEREKFEDMRSEYYQAVGWDEMGVPTRETLQRLELEDVIPILEKKGLVKE